MRSDADRLATLEHVADTATLLANLGAHILADIQDARGDR